MPSLIPSLTSWSGEKYDINCSKCDSYNGCCRDFTTTHTVGVAEILQSLIQSGCSRNSATFYTLDVAEILGPFIHWVLQKFCDHSYTGCSRNSATIRTQRCRRNSGTSHTLGVAEIPQPLINWIWQKICDHSCTGCRRNSATTHRLDLKEIPRKNTTLTVPHIWISISTTVHSKELCYMKISLKGKNMLSEKTFLSLCRLQMFQE